MTDLVVINGQNVEFEVVNGGTFTTSLSVAQVFEKNHKNIIRKINEFPKDDFNQLNFEPVTYLDAKGEERKAYKITRDGFVMLVMGFTGEKAYRFKIDYINAFNKIQHLLKNKELESNNKLISNLEKRNKRVALGYKSQLAQQKEKYELKLKVLECELEHKNKIDYDKPSQELKKALAERGWLLMNKNEFLFIAEHLATKINSGASYILGTNKPKCLNQLATIAHHACIKKYESDIDYLLGKKIKYWGLTDHIEELKIKRADSVWSPIYNKWVIEDGEQIAGWELELKWKGDTKIQHGS
ncbi:Rha family transcriptional regulator [Campylobacter sp. RM12637]|uniref:Rha family transcriptional regulator n=1 Tax=Campylobacter sp. RM12637 TaxID=2735734 RepID=UPI003014E23B|nr:Rha family transcriptional regulator [Campylobacter sp. RM12637]